MAIVPVYPGLARYFRPPLAAYPVAYPPVVFTYPQPVGRYPALPPVPAIPPPYGWPDPSYWYRVTAASYNPGNFYLWPPGR